MKTAIADPTPRLLAPPNAVRHIARAITLASSCTEPGATETTMSKTLEDVDQHRDEHDREHRHEERRGHARNTCHSVAPSVRAASMTSRGMAASPAAITTIEKPAQIQM